MSTCAVIQDSLVINLIVAEPTDTPPNNCTLVLVPDDVFVTIGFTWDGTNFIDLEGNPSVPNENIVEELPPDEDVD
jgi:hypothetical protein